MRHTISCVVKSRPGVIAGITEGLARRQINIHSLAVTETEGEATSRITLVIEGDEGTLATVASQLAALDVVEAVDDLDRSGFLDRELVLVKIGARPEDLPRIMQICEVMHAGVAAMGIETMTLEMANTAEKTSAFIRLLRPFGIREYARSGCVAVGKED